MSQSEGTRLGTPTPAIVRPLLGQKTRHLIINSVARAFLQSTSAWRMKVFPGDPPNSGPNAHAIPGLLHAEAEALARGRLMGGR